MADWKPKENKGALQRNDFKEKETQPDYKGLLNITKEEFDRTGGIIKISAWMGETKTNKPYISLSVDTYVPKEQSPF